MTNTQLTTTTAKVEKLHPDVVQLIGDARELIKKSKSENTLKAYASDRGHFEIWCRRRKLSPELPVDAEIITLYITWLAKNKKMKHATIVRRLSSLSAWHEANRFESPTKSFIVKATVQGITREFGTRQERADGFSRDDLDKMLAVIPDTLSGTRDRALLLVGIAGNFRSSELVSLNVGDGRLVKEGLRILLRRSKTDQAQQGKVVDIDFGNYKRTCPVTAYNAWLEASGIKRGAVWRSVGKGNTTDHIGARLNRRDITRIVLRYMDKAGIADKKFSAHSFRATFATWLAQKKVDPFKIKEMGRWKTLKTVDIYVRDAQEFTLQRTKLLGL